MKKFSLVILLLVLLTYSYTQEISTKNTKDSQARITSIGYFGGPFVSATQINNDWGLKIGGKGGALLNNKFAVGATGMGIESNYISHNNNLSDYTNVPMQLGIGAAGIFIEYVFNFRKLVHFSIPLNIMGGGIAVKDKNTGIEIESSGIFVVEPGLNLELNISRYFISGVNISYRQVIGSSLINFDAKDISGLNIVLIFRFGYYY